MKQNKPKILDLQRILQYLFLSSIQCKESPLQPPKQVGRANLSLRKYRGWKLTPQGSLQHLCTRLKTVNLTFRP